MASIRTYIFGNPDGWSLYESDPDELKYFRRFYMNSGRGSRLTVNRRADGSVAYVYINYGLADSTDIHRNAHFGMAAVIDRDAFTPQFNTVFRFMEALFGRVVEMPDGLFDRNWAGLRYRVQNLSDGAETIEWIKKTLPKIFDKTGLQQLSTDTSFIVTTAGQTATFPDTATDGEILYGFRANDCVVISPIFRKGKAKTSVPAEPQDFLDSYAGLSQQLLDHAIGSTNLSIADLEKIISQINNSRNTLSKCTVDNPGDADKAKSLLTGLSRLHSSAKVLIEKAVIRDARPASPLHIITPDVARRAVRPQQYPERTGFRYIISQKYFKPAAALCAVCIIALLVVIFLPEKKQAKTTDAADQEQTYAVNSYDATKTQEASNESNLTATLEKDENHDINQEVTESLSTRHRPADQDKTEIAKVTCNGKTKEGEALGFDVKGDFTITSSLPLRCRTSGTEVTFSKDRKTAKVTNPKANSKITFTSGKTTIHITVKHKATYKDSRKQAPLIKPDIAEPVI